MSPEYSQELDQEEQEQKRQLAFAQLQSRRQNMTKGVLSNAKQRLRIAGKLANKQSSAVGIAAKVQKAKKWAKIMKILWPIILPLLKILLIIMLIGSVISFLILAVAAVRQRIASIFGLTSSVSSTNISNSTNINR